jgi:hypothetical protein
MSPVEQLKNEYEAIEKYLHDTSQISLLSDLNKNFRKVLLLSAGSYFESEITTILIDFVRTKSNNDERIINFLEKQAISQKYFQLFSWGERNNPEKPVKNASTFWKLFGDNFKSFIDSELHEKPDITESVEAFIEIGHLRNILVHSNFASYNYDQKTTDEIYELYKKAEPFIDFVKQKLQ